MKPLLLIGPQSLEDAVLATALPAALKRRFPEHKIVWLLDEAFLGLIEAHPEVDEIIPWPRERWRRLWLEGKWWRLAGEFGTLWRKIGWRRFDRGIVLGRAFLEHLLALQAARDRIGFRGGWFLTEEITTSPSPWFAAPYRRLLHAFDLESSDFLPKIVLSERAEEKAKELLKRWRLWQKPYALLVPEIPLPLWSRLACLLYEHFGWRSLAVSGRREALTMASRARGLALPITEWLPPEVFAALIARSEVVFTTRPVVLYLAIAFKKSAFYLLRPPPFRQPALPQVVLLYPPRWQGNVQEIIAALAPKAVRVENRQQLAT